MCPLADDDNDTLDEDSVRDYLSSLGLDPAPGAIVEPLGAEYPTSCWPLGRPRRGRGQASVGSSSGRRPLAAPRDRAIAEAEALDLVGALTPGAAPAVLDRDLERSALVVERPPPAGRTGSRCCWPGRSIEGWLSGWVPCWPSGTAPPGRGTAFRPSAPDGALRSIACRPVLPNVARRRPETAVAVLDYGPR